VIAGGLVMGAFGLAVLTQIGAAGGLAPLVAGSLVISFGLAPVFGLTTELIAGSVAPEQAGAASGINETGVKLGGALGIAILGSIGAAVYRGELADRLPAGVPAEAAAVARDTLGGAVAVAGQLPDQLGGAVLQAARGAFVRGMHLSSAIAAVVALGLAVFAAVMLRDRPAASPEVHAAAEAAEAAATPCGQLEAATRWEDEHEAVAAVAARARVPGWAVDAGWAAEVAAAGTIVIRVAREPGARAPDLLASALRWTIAALLLGRWRC
jgi:hypothetical protein